MLTSIHPLGERARHNRWAVTVGAFVVGAVGAATAVGAILGQAGAYLLGGGWRWPFALLVVLGAGLADLARVRPPGPRRQVNENWIGAFRGWVYGGAFGAQLGLGAVTYVVTWGVWATAALAVLGGGLQTGALIGAAFGLGRSVFPLAAGWIDRPSRLGAFGRAMAAVGPWVARAVTFAFLTLAVVLTTWRAV